MTRCYLLLKAPVLRVWVRERRVKVACEQGKNGVASAY